MSDRGEFARVIHAVLEADYGKCDHNPDHQTGESYAVCERIASVLRKDATLGEVVEVARLGDYRKGATNR